MVQSAPVCDHHADPVYGRPHGGELLRKDQHLARAVDQQLALEARLRQEEQAVRDAQRQLAEARSVIDTLQDKLQVPVLNGGGGRNAKSCHSALSTSASCRILWSRNAEESTIHSQKQNRNPEFPTSRSTHALLHRSANIAKKTSPLVYRSCFGAMFSVRHRLPTKKSKPPPVSYATHEKEDCWPGQPSCPSTVAPQSSRLRQPPQAPPHQAARFCIPIPPPPHPSMVPLFRPRLSGRGTPQLGFHSRRSEQGGPGGGGWHRTRRLSREVRGAFGVAEGRL